MSFPLEKCDRISQIQKEDDQSFLLHKLLHTGERSENSVLLTNDDKEEYSRLVKREEALYDEIAELEERRNCVSTKDTIKYLHEYNDIRDAVQIVLGAIARSSGVTFLSLHKEYKLPELSITKHLNGKIIILDFFTYCCINCMHILPDLNALEMAFPIEDGLVVIGVHNAKFSNERESKKILFAVQRHGIAHPVVNDAKLSMWKDIGIICWPSLVMLGPKGQLLAVFIGEGHKEELFLYVKLALTYFRSVGCISSQTLPLHPACHLLPISKGALLFPGKVETLQTCEGEKLMVSDSGNNRILIVKLNGRTEHIIGGYNPGFKDGDFREARFNAPQGVCALGDVVFVADNGNHAIRRIDLTKKYVTTIAGTGFQGYDLLGGKDGRDQVLSSPWDVAIYHHESNGHVVPVLLIAMAGTHQIWALFLENTDWWKKTVYKGGICVAIVGNGREENRNNSYPHRASLAQPSGLTISQERKILFFADSESSSIRQVDLQDGKVSAVCGADWNPENLHQFGDVDGTRYSAQLQHPIGVAWHHSEKVVYIADTYNHKIKKVDLTGKCTTLYGVGKPNSAFSFDEPSGVAVSSNGDMLFVADTNNHTIKKINLKAIEISSLAIVLPEETYGTGNYMYSFSTVISANGGEVNIFFDIGFEGDLKLNADAPQKWILDLPSSDHLWIAKTRTGALNEPISVRFPESNGREVLSITIETVACKTNECILKTCRVTFDVYLKANAPKLVTERKLIVIK